MAQEGMPLTKELKQTLYNCIVGKTTTEIERREIIEKYRVNLWTINTNKEEQAQPKIHM